MVSRQEVSRVIPFCANRQNVSGIIESLTPACVVRHYDNKSLKHGHSCLDILHSLLRVVKSLVASPYYIRVVQVVLSS